MEPITFAMSGDTLTITVKLPTKGTTSASGKSEVLASTRGNVTVDGTDIKVGLNIYRPVLR